MTNALVRASPEICLRVKSFYARAPWHAEVPQGAATASLVVCRVLADARPAAFRAAILAFARSVLGRARVATQTLLIHCVLGRALDCAGSEAQLGIEDWRPLVDSAASAAGKAGGILHAG